MYGRDISLPAASSPTVQYPGKAGCLREPAKDSIRGESSTPNRGRTLVEAEMGWKCGGGGGENTVNRDGGKWAVDTVFPELRVV